MRQTELHLTDLGRLLVDELRGKGLHPSRVVNRAQVQSSLDRGVREAQIMAALGMGPTAVWRTRAAYLQGVSGGWCSTLHALAGPANTTRTTMRA